MSANRAVRLYQQTRQLTASDKQNDARLLTQLCFNLTQALQTADWFSINQAQGDMRLAWVTISGNLQDPAHPYPDTLREQLLQLADLVLAQLNLPQEQVDWPLVQQCSQSLADGLAGSQPAQQQSDHHTADQQL